MSDLGMMKSAKRLARWKRSQKGRKGTWGHRFRVVETLVWTGRLAETVKFLRHPTNGNTLPLK